MSEPVVVSEVAGSDRRRLKVLGAAAVALLLVAVVVPKVLFGGGDGGDDEVALGPATPAPGASPPAGSGDASTDPVILRGFSDRNPFTPLVGPAGGGGLAGVPAADPGTGTAVPVVPEPVFFPFPAPAPEPAPAPAPPPSSPPPTEPPPASEPRSYRFSLLEVHPAPDGRPAARVRVDDAVIDVVAGQDFAGSFRAVVIDLDARCARFLYGDAPFTLCEGEEIHT